MAKKQLDFRGMKCPLPVLKLNQYAAKNEAHPGDVVEVLADCPTFEDDVKKWCQDAKKILIKCYLDGTTKIAHIQF